MSRCAVVTGAGRGIGLAIARRLRDDGWRVEVCDLDPGEARDEPGLTFWELDVTDPVAVADVFAAIDREAGGIDALVNNAGITRRAPIERLSWEDWRAVIDVDLHGVFLCLQAAGRAMLARGAGGAVVNIASIAAERGQPGRAPYGAAKAAVVGLTRTAAVEWAARGIRVNAVGPGYVDTGVFRSGVASGQLDAAEILSRIPMGRVGPPADIAAAVAWLVSPESGYVTGQVLYVDGGFLADFGVGLKEPE
jgi:3-oxoacyl-[acyl-carrier protein] reductase